MKLTQEQVSAIVNALRDHRYDTWAHDPGCDCCGLSVIKDKSPYGDSVDISSVATVLENIDLPEPKRE